MKDFCNVNHVMIHITRKAFEGAPYKCTGFTEINGGPATLCSKLQIFSYFPSLRVLLVLLYLIMGDFSQGRHHIYILHVSGNSTAAAGGFYTETYFILY